MEIKLNDVTIKNAIQIMKDDNGIGTFKEVAEKVGIKEYTFRSALHNNALRVRELKEIADLLGYEIILKKKW